jgi:hypothetical protein
MKKNKNNSNKINNGNMNIKRNSNFSPNNLDIRKNNNKSSINFLNSQNNNQYNDSNSPLINENNFLKQSLSNKNILLSNVLEENNRLNNVLKSNGINILDYKNFKNLNKEQSNNNSNTTINNIQPNKEDEIIELKNNLSEYENKLYYFNDYINNIKKQIYSLQQNMSQILKKIITDDLNDKNTKNDNKEKNNIFLSDNFYKGINNINEKIKDINIEFYNLDYTNDIKCFETYKEMTNIINDEMKNILSYYKNLNFINKKENDSIIDLFELCKAVINEKPINKTLTDIFNITQGINKLYREKYLNNKNTNNDNKENNSIFLSDNFYKGMNNLNDRIKDISIEFYNLDYSNDIKCFETYKEMTNIIKDEMKNILSYYKNLNFINKKENDSIIDLFELCKAVINEKPINKTLTDIFNITQGINKLYKEKYLNNKNKDISNEEIDLDKILIGQERELDYIKKSLFNVVNSRKTYSLNRNYNNNRLYNLNKYQSKVNSQTEGNEVNYNEKFNENFDFKNINNDNYFRNNYYSKTNNNFYKRLNNSRNNIINKTYT